MPPHHTPECRDEPICVQQDSEQVFVKLEETRESEKSSTEITVSPKSISHSLHICAPHEEEEEHHHLIHKADIVRIALVAVAVLASILKVWTYIPHVPFDIIALIAVVLGGYPIYKEAFLEGILRLKMTMELSMTIALVSAMAIEQFETAVIIVLFVLIAEVLEHLTVGQGRKALQKLTDILPSETFVVEPRTKEVTSVNISDLKVGDLVMIKPGARIPVDGKVC